jgi:hypothetical protein
VPRRFPIVQFPNRSLLLAVLAGTLAQSSTGPVRRVAALVSRLASIYWAAQELVAGANWFRRLLGLAVGAQASSALAKSLRR